MEILGISLGFLSLLSFSLAQFPPTPSGLSIVNSKVNEQVKISYKEVRTQFSLDSSLRHF